MVGHGNTMVFSDQGRMGYKTPTNWLGQAKRQAIKIRPNADGIFDRFSNFDEFRPAVGAGDVISGVDVE